MSAAESRRVPKDQIEGVVKALYAGADRLDWEHLPATNRTSQYDDWVTDPEIGGVLTKYMSSENARSWIKDGPMKEYGRARLGAGRYARFGSAIGPTADDVVKHALGSDAAMVVNSQGVKPFHCLTKVDRTTTFVVWDAAKNLRHLVWATINHLASNPTHEGCIVILETLDHPITHAEKTRHQRIAERCSIAIKYYRVASRQSTGGERT
jgi:hypothetical protein